VAQPTLLASFSCVPTVTSWLNLIERWFGELTSKRVSPGRVLQCRHLQGHYRFHECWNDWNRKPFVWTATVRIHSKPTRSLPPDPEQIPPDVLNR